MISDSWPITTQMDFVFVEFISKWIREGRFPREELRIRWPLAALGCLVIGALAIALLIAAT